MAQTWRMIWTVRKPFWGEVWTVGMVGTSERKSKWQQPWRLVAAGTDLCRGNNTKLVTNIKWQIDLKSFCDSPIGLAFESTKEVDENNVSAASAIRSIIEVEVVAYQKTHKQTSPVTRQGGRDHPRSRRSSTSFKATFSKGWRFTSKQCRKNVKICHATFYCWLSRDLHCSCDLLK